MRRALALALLALLLAGVAGAQTFLRDDTGAVAPPVVFRGSGGAQTTAQGSDPLPVTGNTSTPTSSTTDPSGWGRRWFSGAITFQTGDNEAAAFFADAQTAYVMGGGLGTNRELYRSSGRGSAFTFVGNATVSDGGATGDVNYVFRTSAGSYLLVGMASGVTTVRPFRATNPLGPWTVATIPGGVPVNSRPNGGMAQQASTILLGITDPAIDQGHLLRSTNDGQSWTTLISPTGLNGFTANPGVNTLFNTASVASPAVNVWLAIDNDGRIFRSTNDGVSFAQTQQIGAASNTDAGVICVSSTICAAWIGTAVFRSTDAGVTWAQVATFSVAPRTMVSLGSDIVIAASAVISTVTFFRSGDAALTWEQLPAVTPAASCVNGNYSASTSSARNGAVVLGWDCVNPGGGPGRFAFYSPIIGGGELGVIGENGVRLDINSSGHGGAYQGAGAVNSGSLEAWQVTPVQRGTLTNSQTTGAANTAVTVTIAAVANTRAHLYKATGRCAAGTSALTVESPAGTTIWSTPAAAVGTANFAEEWSTGLTAATNTAMVITLAACGAGNAGTLIVQTDRF